VSVFSIRTHYRDIEVRERHFVVSAASDCLDSAVNFAGQRDVSASQGDVENDAMYSASGMVEVEEPMEYSSFRKL
jgi:hypothetical protein